jgi:hypothetical protein
VEKEGVFLKLPAWKDLVCTTDTTIRSGRAMSSGIILSPSTSALAAGTTHPLDKFVNEITKFKEIAAI